MARRTTDQASRVKPAKAPVSTHPAFPFIVALWFAALLGIGSLVVPVVLIERLSAASGLAGFFPAAAPPLGFTARALIALACTLGGGLLGLVIARKVAAAHRASAPSRASILATARPPISAHAELGAQGLDGPFASTAVARGRRTLAIEEEERPSDFLDIVAAHGSSRESGLTAWDGAREAMPLEDELELDEELELTADLLAPEAPVSDMSEVAENACAAPPCETSAGASDNAQPGFSSLGKDDRNPDMDHRQTFIPGGDAGVPTHVTWHGQVRPQGELNGPRLPDSLPSGRMQVAVDSEVIPFSPPSLSRIDTAHLDEDEGDEEQPLVDHQQFAGADVSGGGIAGHGQETSAEELDSLGLVQLAQRLGSSIERRRELRAARAFKTAIQANQGDGAVEIPHASAPLLDKDVPLAAPDEAAQAMAAWFAASLPAQTQGYGADGQRPENARHEKKKQVFQPIAEDSDLAVSVPSGSVPKGLADALGNGIDEDEGEHSADIAELAASLTLPIGNPARPASSSPASAISGKGPEALTNPFRSPQHFVRIEDEPQSVLGDTQPAVVFPSQESTAAAMPATPQTAGRIAAAEPEPVRPAIDPEEQARALREALLNLQRVSGAA